jgi:hypothetical protein
VPQGVVQVPHQALDDGGCRGARGFAHARASRRATCAAELKP